jgi:phenylacetate-coenzyme A ligase PaaK-like adenylate-forming protein
LSTLTEKIFAIKTESDFEETALAVFHLQHKQCLVYRQFCDVLKINPAEIKSVNDIPFLPIEFFKTHMIVTSSVPDSYRDEKLPSKLFTSSGTGGLQSKHHVSDISIYEESFRKGFELFYGNIQEYCLLALLPSYLEREGSSLVYMANDLIAATKNPDSCFYLHNLNELSEKLNSLLAKGQKVLLLGVTYALLDLAELISSPLSGEVIIMETGGMKGKRKELLREELHQILCDKFGVKSIHSEYGMTELLSQAYSKGNGIFNCPPWVKVVMRDVNDPLKILETGKSGGINVIDLANINSCSFIATQDLGIHHNDGSFEVSGRFDNSDLRGCNLLVQ